MADWQRVRVQSIIDGLVTLVPEEAEQLSKLIKVPSDMLPAEIQNVLGEGLMIDWMTKLGQMKFRLTNNTPPDVAQ